MGRRWTEATRLRAGLAAGVAFPIACATVAAAGDAKQTSFWVQLVGGLVTTVGLLVAYLRAKHPGETLREQLADFGRRLRGKTGRAHTAEANLDVTVRPAGAVGLTPLEDLGGLTLQQQVDVLAFYIRHRVNSRTQALLERVGALEVAIVEAREAAEDKAEEIHRRAKADLEALRSDLDQSAALDLRWAIIGVYIATVGLAVGIGT